MLSGNYRMHGYGEIMRPVITGKHDFAMQILFGPTL